MPRFKMRDSGHQHLFTHFLPLSLPLPSLPPFSIAFLNFGLVSTGVLQFATGIVLAVDGGLMLFATFKYPSLFAGNVPAQPSANSAHPAAAATKGPGQV